MKGTSIAFLEGLEWSGCDVEDRLYGLRKKAHGSSEGTAESYLRPHRYWVSVVPSGLDHVFKPTEWKRRPPLVHPEETTILRPIKGAMNSTRPRALDGSPMFALANVGRKSRATRISCYVALDRTACAPFREERRMHCINATKSNRKSGGSPPTLLVGPGYGCSSRGADLPAAS